VSDVANTKVLVTDFLIWKTANQIGREREAMAGILFSSTLARLSEGMVRIAFYIP
jgi:hypothetical protein